MDSGIIVGDKLFCNIPGWSGFGGFVFRYYIMKIYILYIFRIILSFVIKTTIHSDIFVL